MPQDETLLQEHLKTKVEFLRETALFITQKAGGPL